MKAIKSPIPIDIEDFIGSGIAFIIFSLVPKTVKSKNTSPDKKTIPKDVCQGIFSDKHKEKVKNAFNPIPGAMAIGEFAKKATAKQEILETNAVTVIKAPLSIPVLLNIFG